MAIDCYVPAPTLVCDGILSILILEDWQVYLHVASSFPMGLLSMAWMPRTSWSLLHWCHWWGSWYWTSVTFKPMIWWEQRWLGWGHPYLSLSLVLILTPHSWWTGWGLSLDTSHHSATAGMFAGHGDKSWLQKLNGVKVGGIEWGWLDPLGLVCPSVMAWAISCQPLPRLASLALSWAALPTQLMVTDSINVASCASPKLSPSPNDHHP